MPPAPIASVPILNLSLTTDRHSTPKKNKIFASVFLPSTVRCVTNFLLGPVSLYCFPDPGIERPNDQIRIWPLSFHRFPLPSISPSPFSSFLSSNIFPGHDFSSRAHGSYHGTYQWALPLMHWTSPWDLTMTSRLSLTLFLSSGSCMVTIALWSPLHCGSELLHKY